MGACGVSALSAGATSREPAGIASMMPLRIMHIARSTLIPIFMYLGNVHASNISFHNLVVIQYKTI
jgi:hypothetical protein